MTKERLGKYIQEYSVKNKKDLGYPVYSVTNSKGFCTEYFNKDVSGANKTTYKIVPRGFFAYNPSRINVGSIDWQNCEDNVIVSPLYVVFKCSDGLNQDYLKYYLKSDCGKRQINARVSGAVRNNLKFSVLSNFELEIGSIEKQQTVVKVLKKIEEALDHEIEQLRLYDELVKSRFIEMFGTVANPKYEVSTLGQECRFKSGTTMPVDVELETGDFIYAKVSDMNLDGNEIELTHSKKYLSKDSAKNTWLPVGTVIFPKRGAAIFTNKKRILVENSCVDLNIMGVIPGERLASKYLYSFFQSIDLKGIADNSGIPQINNKHLFPLKIVVPPMSVQNAFIRFQEQVDKSRMETQKRINLYKELLSKKTDELFNGESA